MVKRNARATIGLPVFNGEEYLGEAIESILNQTFTDFRLILSDNGSTDRTPTICASYAGKDSRVTYCRSEINRGAAYNFNRTFQLAEGEFFKWAAHDDRIAPSFLERCIEVMDRDPGVVLCYPRAVTIDSRGDWQEFYVEEIRGDSGNPCDRFRDLMLHMHRVYHVFGVIRAEVLARTSLIGPYTSSDRVLLGELALYGRFFQIPEYLFFSRIHVNQSCKMYPRKEDRMVWFTTEKEGRVVFPLLRYFFEAQRTIWKAAVGIRDKAICSMLMNCWAKHHVRELLGELKRSSLLLFSRLAAPQLKGLSRRH